MVGEEKVEDDQEQKLYQYCIKAAHTHTHGSVSQRGGEEVDT